MSLASLFSPGTYDKVNDNRAAIGATLDGDSPYWKAGDLGAAGQDLMQQAATLGATPITANTSSMDADMAKQAAIGQIYANLFANGGLAEAAQRDIGNADIANSAQGGAAGIANQIAGSRKIMGQTSAVGSQERGQNGAGANMSAFQVAQAQLQKLTLEAQAAHASRMNALNAHAVQNFLGNQQIENDQNLYGAASGARSSQANLNQNVSNTNWKAGVQVGTAGLAGATTGAGVMATAFGTPAMTPNTALSQGIYDVNQLTLTSPATQLRMATTSANPYYPGTLQNTYPTAANAWALPGTTALIP